MAALAQHAPPSSSPHTTSANVAGSGGPQTSASQQANPSDFKIFKQSVVNSTCSGCGQSTINEPSAANNGKDIVETSNWNIAYSTNGANGSTPWLNLNPYSFDSAFCCDQQVVYDPGRNIFLLLQLAFAGNGNASNGLDLSIAQGTKPTSWCTYHFAGAIGSGSTDTPDFPKIALGNNNAYVTWNDYNTSGGFVQAGIARFPLDSLAACAGFSYNFLNRTENFTFALTQGASSLDTYYWVSNWYTNGTTNGSNMRIYSWAENSGSVSFVDRAINAFNFSTVSCGTPNWCSRLDPRYESAVITRAEYRAQANASFAGDTLLEVAGTAGPSGFSSGKNYVVYNYFKLNGLTYIGNDQTFSTTTNFAYPGCAVNQHGYVGCGMMQGTNAPGGLIVLQDDISRTQPWAYNFTPAATNGAGDGGDYTVTSTWYPAVGPFQTVLWRVNSSNAVEPNYIVWGRQREQSAFTRWKK